jgi:apolipoprotein N-acyltransferase
MNKYILVALSVVSGMLLGLAWITNSSGLILLVAFVPFFLIEENLYNNAEKYLWNAFFLYTLPGFVIFNILAIGWVRVSTLTGAVFIIMGLSFLMSFTLWLAHIIRLKAGNTAGYISFVSFWLSLEYINLNTSIITPWLNLGNGLAKDILFIQWYDITGAAGGTLWIICSNLAFFVWINKYIRKKSFINTYLWLALALAVIPATISILRYYNIEQIETGAMEVVIIQPNVDPYTEKFSIPFVQQWEKALSMAESAVTEKTTWVITPETTIDDPVNEDDMHNDKYIIRAKEFINKHSHLSLISGMVSYRSFPDENGHTDSLYYNSAFKIDTGNRIEIYHKSKLVPGVEMQFSEGPLNLLTRLLPYFGGTQWGYTKQKERINFEHASSQTKIAPVICYESVYGNFVAEYVRNGAGAIFIITNDGWWKNTSGYKQHLSYASIRAIETRRPVVRAANTGISCIIDIKGKRITESGWWDTAIITGKINPETRVTPYVKYGEYLMRIASLISILILSIVFIAIPLRKKNKSFEA